MKWAYLTSLSGSSEIPLLVKDQNPGLIKSCAKPLDRILLSIFSNTKTCINPYLEKESMGYFFQKS